MNTILKKPGTLIKYSLTIMLAAVLLGLIFLFTFGFNTAPEFGGVYELTIFSFDSSQNEKYIDTAKEILDGYGYTATEVIIEEHNDSDAITIRYPSESKNNAIKIQAELTTKLGLNENLVKIENLTNATQKTNAIKLLITLGVMILALGVYGWLRHNWKFAATLVSVLALSVILPLSIINFTRLELSFSVLGVIILGAALTAILYMATYAKITQIARSQDKQKTFKSNFIDFADSIKFKLIIPVALVLAAFVALIFTFTRGLIMVGLAGVIMMVVDAFLLAIFAPALQILLNKEKN